MCVGKFGVVGIYLAPCLSQCTSQHARFWSPPSLCFQTPTWNKDPHPCHVYPTDTRATQCLVWCALRAVRTTTTTSFYCKSVDDDCRFVSALSLSTFAPVSTLREFGTHSEDMCATRRVHERFIVRHLPTGTMIRRLIVLHDPALRVFSRVQAKRCHIIFL